LCSWFKAAADGALPRSGSAPVRTLVYIPDGIRVVPDRLARYLGPIIEQDFAY
jgi:hypothetical protein